MALLMLGHSTCAICDKVLVEEDDIFGTSGVFLPASDRLHEMCDACMHWECYAGWKYRRRFARAYVNARVQSTDSNPHWGRAYLDENLFISLNPELKNEGLSIVPVETGSDIRINLTDWSSFLLDPRSVEMNLHAIEVRALEWGLKPVRETLPTSDSLISAVDWPAKAEILRKLDEESKRSNEAALLEIAAYNSRFAPIVARLKIKSKKVRCPRCGVKGREIRYVDRSPKSKSYLVCQECGRSFGPENMTKG